MENQSPGRGGFVAIFSPFCYPRRGRRGLRGVKAMIQIRLQPEIEAQLAAEAQARGVALDRYIEKIVIARPVDRIHKRTVAEAIESIREQRKGNCLGGLDLKDLIHEGHKY